MDPYITGIKKQFQKHGNAANALPMKKYMRDQFEFYGIKADERRMLSLDYIKSVGIPEGEDRTDIIKELWSLPQRDFQYFAIELMIKCKKQWNESDIHLIEYMITNKSWWDTVDFIATRVAGPWFKKFPSHIKSVTTRWNTSENIWLQRMSILFQLKYKEDTDLKLLFKYIRHLSESGEFFVQKAIGWILRELSKANHLVVIEFLETNKLKPLSRREAMKILNKKK